MTILAPTFDTLCTYAGSLTWSPLVRFSRGAVLSLLRRVAIGQLIVTDTDDTVTICGAPQIKDGTPRTELKVLRETFWVRVLLFADMVSCSSEAGLLGPPSKGRRAERILLGIRRELHVGRDCLLGFGSFFPGRFETFCGDLGMIEKNGR